MNQRKSADDQKLTLQNFHKMLLQPTSDQFCTREDR